MSIPRCATVGCNNMCSITARISDAYCELCCYKQLSKNLTLVTKQIPELEKRVKGLEEQVGKLTYNAMINKIAG